MIILTYPKSFGDPRNIITPTLTVEGVEGECKVTRISATENGHKEIAIMVPLWEITIRDLRKGDET